MVCLRKKARKSKLEAIDRVKKQTNKPKKRPVRRKPKSKNEGGIPKNEKRIRPARPSGPRKNQLELAKYYLRRRRGKQQTILTKQQRLEAMISVLGGYRERRASNPDLKSYHNNRRSIIGQDTLHEYQQRFANQPTPIKEIKVHQYEFRKAHVIRASWTTMQSSIIYLEYLRNPNPSDDDFKYLSRRVKRHKDQIKQWFNLMRGFPKNGKRNYRQCLRFGYTVFPWKRAVAIVKNGEKEKSRKPYGITAYWITKRPSPPPSYEVRRPGSQKNKKKVTKQKSNDPELKENNVPYSPMPAEDALGFAPDDYVEVDSDIWENSDDEIMDTDDKYNGASTPPPTNEPVRQKRSNYCNPTPESYMKRRKEGPSIFTDTLDLWCRIQENARKHGNNQNISHEFLFEPLCNLDRNLDEIDELPSTSDSEGNSSSNCEIEASSVSGSETNFSNPFPGNQGQDNPNNLKDGKRRDSLDRGSCLKNDFIML